MLAWFTKGMARMLTTANLLSKAVLIVVLIFASVLALAIGVFLALVQQGCDDEDEC
jgi:hypothetical protein